VPFRSRWPDASTAATVTRVGTPTAAVSGVTTSSWAKVRAGLTVVVALPVMELVVVSVAVMVWLPVAARLTWNRCLPWSLVVKV
jgi:hypothetical protein